MLEVSTLLISIVCICAVPALVISQLRGVLPSHLFLPLLVADLGVLLVLRRVQYGLLSIRLASRSDSLLNVFRDLPRRYVGLEDGDTYQKTKLLPEDQGVCLLDCERQRLLIEGCTHRYVIYGKDVSCIEAVSAYSLSGVLLDFTVGGGDLKVMLSVAGHGPLASLTGAFNPGKGAKDFADILNVTLFGIEAPSQ
jgi:hypothetical protein